MTRQILRKFIAFVMVMAVLTVSMHAYCPEAAATEPACAAGCQGDAGHGLPAGDQADASHTEEHSVPSHCDSSCLCPCHASLTVDAYIFICSLRGIPIDFYDPFKAVPEVYLPRFVPPHILS